ncbi:MAG: hypothetical protein L0Z47_00650 [Actinobacteria bacterium]|nr:hypothetical protein [Actinomycetota bacterium]
MTRLLARPDYEVIPLGDVRDRVGAVSIGATVTVTASPSRGTKATIDLACELQRMGYVTVPHIAARMISDRGELGSVIARLHEAGASQVFVIGGDPEPRGDYRTLYHSSET